MGTDRIVSISDEPTLLCGINARQPEAFGEVYLLYYNELYYFSSRLYGSTEVSSEDIVHDVFVKMWKSNLCWFESLLDVRAYLYTSIRNGFKNFALHTRSQNRYIEAMKTGYDSTVDAAITESELLRIVFEMTDRLPRECARVFRLFLEGYSAHEIADKLGKKESTIYAQKEFAIQHLRKNLDPEKLYLFMTFFFG